MIFYADQQTDSIRRTLAAVAYRREKQLAFNREHGITPRSVRRAAQSSLHVFDGTGRREAEPVVAETVDDAAAVIAELEEEMQEAANRLEFERAAVLRDQIDALKSGRHTRGAAPALRSARPAAAKGARRRGR